MPIRQCRLHKPRTCRFVGHPKVTLWITVGAGVVAVAVAFCGWAPGALGWLVPLSVQKRTTSMYRKQFTASLVPQEVEPPERHHPQQPQQRIVNQKRENQRSTRQLPAAIHKSHNNESSSSSSSSFMFTMEYSPNFQRHIVRDSNNGVVQQSFLWFDEALDAYPNVITQRLPVHAYPHHRYAECQFRMAAGAVPSEAGTDSNNHTAVKNINTTTTATSASILVMDECGLEDDEVLVMVTGGGLNETTAYPVLQRDSCSDDDNLERVFDCFQSILFWDRRQVEQLIEIWPPLRTYPAPLLEERLRFFLSPLPDPDILQQANITEDLDWPQLFYVHGRGAGLSVAQVSHALQILPEPWLLRLNYHAYRRPQTRVRSSSTATSSGSMLRNPTFARMLTHIYECTPSVVTQIIHWNLDLWVTGVSSLDVIFLSYLYWKGWDWQGCRIVLHAFPSCQQCSLEPSWEQRSPAGTAQWLPRQHFIGSALSYLQLRLHVRPWQISAMIKTHPRLSGYGDAQLKRNMDFLQERIPCLRSRDLRKVVMLMPSLLGASVPALDSRICFWTEQVGMTVEQLRDMVVQKPAMLHYSVARNLQPKLDFFAGELELDPQTLRKLTLAVPELWCRSQTRFFVPLMETFGSECGGMTSSEFGRIISEVPQLVRYSNMNLRSKMQFLKKRLGWTGNQFKPVIQISPKVLLQSIPTIVEPKISFLETVSSGNCSNLLQMNPWLLSLSRNKLKEIVERADRDDLESTKTIVDTLAQWTKGSRRQKEIWVLSEESRQVEMKFSGVADAARHAETSQSNMYRVLREGRPWKERVYVYAHQDSAPMDDFVEFVAQLKDLQKEGASSNNESARNTTALIIQTTGAAFPPEDTVRGRRRAGGMALQILSWSPDMWRGTCAGIWNGRRVRLRSDGHTVMLGYHYERPSRPRCSLYACLEALRVATQWVDNAPQGNSMNIHIHTDSNYVVELLQNSSQILDWGRHQTKDDFLASWANSSYRCDLYQANSDILYPLCRSYLRLMEQSTAERDKVVSVQFLPGVPDDNRRGLFDAARLAAKLMFGSTR